MLVDLYCLQDCQPVLEDKPRFIGRGEKISAIEISGKEGWLKYFNVYEHVKPVKPPELKQILIEDLGAADANKEKDDKPTLEDVGAGPAVSLDTIKKKFTVDQLVDILRSNGTPLASSKWKEDTLAKKVLEQRLYVGKL